MLSLNKWAVLDRIWSPHPGQLQVAESSARHRVVSAGRRFGKSNIGGHELVPEALLTRYLESKLLEEGKRREFWIVGPTYQDAEKEFRVAYSQLDKLQVPFDRPGTYNDALSGNMHISLWNGTFQVHAKSAQYPDRLVGEGLSGVILAEAAKLKETVWTKAIRPTLADFNGWSLHTSTPEGKNWFYDNWRRGQDPNNPSWASWRMPAWRNTYVYKEPTRDQDVKFLLDEISRNEQILSAEEIIEKYQLLVDSEILDEMLDLTHESFSQEIMADFTEFVGRVFKGFDEEVHVFDLTYNPNWMTFAAVDYGFTNPNVWLLIQVGPWGEIHVLDEIYESGLSTDEFASEILRRGLCPIGLRTFFPDPASPGDTRILEARLKVRHTGGTGGELKHRLEAIRDALRPVPLHLSSGHREKLPTLKIDRKCKHTIYDFNEYRYPKSKNEQQEPELPMKKDDHAPEALGRFFAGYYGTTATRARPNRVRKANFKR